MNEHKALTSSAEETFQFGYAIGKSCITTPLIISLIGDLGCGKTAFVQGLARGLDVPDTVPVTSPTYGIIHTYSGKVTIHHVDLYRLKDHDEEQLEQIGLSEIFDDDAVIAIEWADRLPALWYEHYVSLSLTFTILSDQQRDIHVRVLKQEQCSLNTLPLIK
ncbi:MAG: tRNA (adenosine(37)-N6)-threonylcarbamoyltransferase complex ATPase subunit type 1 TsaE [Desulfobacterales bacterium]|nr:tRNA (adenosine(37)-N6)-threonylcarbamoyltransferase complex ATPase subunit type 1 TsaE [Desulfobacterales bacterium]